MLLAGQHPNHEQQQWNSSQSSSEQQTLPEHTLYGACANFQPLQDQKWMWKMDEVVACHESENEEQKRKTQVD